MKVFRDNQEFTNKFKEAMDKKKEPSEWPFSGHLGNLKTPLSDKND